ncbi:MAG TPA: hypothetical protein VGI40_20975 [Pirellulaceae bacterium]
MRRNPPRVKRLGFEKLESRSLLSATGWGMLSGGGFANDLQAAASGFTPGAGGFGYGYGYGGVASGGFGNDGSSGAAIGNAAFGNLSFGNGSTGNGSFGGIGNGSYSAPVGFGGGVALGGVPRATDLAGDTGMGFNIPLELNGTDAAREQVFAEFGGSGLADLTGSGPGDAPAPEATTGVGQMTITTGANTLGISSFATSTNGFSDISGGGGMVLPGKGQKAPTEDGGGSQSPLEGLTAPTPR